MNLKDFEQISIPKRYEKKKMRKKIKDLEKLLPYANDKIMAYDIRCEIKRLKKKENNV